MTRIRPLETMLLMLVMALLAGLAALVLLSSAQTATTTPVVGQVEVPEEVLVRPNTHAEIRHGLDALKVRLAVYNCDPRYIQVFVSDGANPKSIGKWLFVCPDSSVKLCAGMIVGMTPGEDGVHEEFSAYVKTCDDWLVRVPIRDGFMPAPVAIVKKALVLISSWEVGNADNQSQDS